VLGAALHYYSLSRFSTAALISASGASRLVQIYNFFAPWAMSIIIPIIAGTPAASSCRTSEDNTADLQSHY
jgi:hypothetical protein